MGKKEKKTKKKGKRQRTGRKHESVKIWQKYEVKGEEVFRKNKFCPRCGEGVWLSEQKDRSYCGKCGYTSFRPVKKHEEKSSEKPAENRTEEKKPGEEKTEEKADEKQAEEKPEEEKPTE